MFNFAHLVQRDHVLYLNRIKEANEILLIFVKYTEISASIKLHSVDLKEIKEMDDDHEIHIAT